MKTDYEEGIIEFVRRKLPDVQFNKEGKITHDNLPALMGVVREYQEGIVKSEQDIEINSRR